MPKRAKSPFPRDPNATLRWITRGEIETHSVDAKLSDTIAHFLEPLLEVDPSPTPESLQAIFTVGAAVWNLGTMERPEWRGRSSLPVDSIEVLRDLASHPESPEGLFQIAEALLHRRRTLFGADPRYLVEVEVMPNADGGFRLRCTGALPADAPCRLDGLTNPP